MICRERERLYLYIYSTHCTQQQFILPLDRLGPYHTIHLPRFVCHLYSLKNLILMIVTGKTDSLTFSFFIFVLISSRLRIFIVLSLSGEENGGVYCMTLESADRISPTYP